MVVTTAVSLLAGVLTVLAPCVLPFLPVIIGGSLGAGSRRRPWIIAGSLVVSLMAFTLLLKATTALLHIDPAVWSIASGVIVIALGASMLVPTAWSAISTRLGLGQRSHDLLHRARGAGTGTASAVLTGAALGPVFSSCSPTYAWVIATVLPAQPAAAMVYLTAYCVGLAGGLLAIALAGRRLVEKLGWAANPRGWFQRALGVAFIVIGLMVATGVDKKVEAWATEWVPSLTSIETGLMPGESSADLSANAAYPAPDLQGIDGWINSSPLTMQQLRGKVVLIDFWTYSCVNCIRTQPWLNAWQKAYADDGLVIVGVHAPEFAFEKKRENVEKAVRDAGIAYPVALDNEFATWNAFNNRYWPAKYLIDRDGVVRYVHYGEGSYDETEMNIRALLGASGDAAAAPTPGRSGGDRSPETYLGSSRAAGYMGAPALADGEATFRAPDTLPVNGWALAGPWRVGGESVTATGAGATLTYRFTGREANLVIAGAKGATVHVEVDGAESWQGADVHGNTLTLDGDRMYSLVRLSQATPGATITIRVDAGAELHAFTFG